MKACSDTDTEGAAQHMMWRAVWGFRVARIVKITSTIYCGRFQLGGQFIVQCHPSDNDDAAHGCVQLKTVARIELMLRHVTSSVLAPYLLRYDKWTSMP